MRLHFYTAVPAALTLFGLVSPLSAQTPANEVDPALAAQGALGVAADDLSTSAGITVFLLSAGFALVFAAICIAVRRADSRTGKHIRFKAGSRSPLAR